jgi:uncharacterized protein YjbI with pentapeptide repeats
LFEVRISPRIGRSGLTEIYDMDFDEALKLLKGRPEGIAEWNRRRAAGKPIPDLTGASLSMADLRHAKLGGATLSDANFSDAKLMFADLSGANLRGANLRGANLERADLSGANLSHADLRHAKLMFADLGDAYLDGANLSRASLSDAKLSGAKLGGANFNNVYCWNTVFADVDLSRAKDLDSVQHFGPSTIGIDTLYRSGGNIPEAFLRGCGVPEYLIENQKALIGSMEPIQFYSCFISYSTKNQDFAERLHSRLRHEGLRVWYSPEDIQGGKKLHEQIDEAILFYDKLLLVLSQESMSSEWVKTEIRKARKAEISENLRKLFPIRLVDFEAIRNWEYFDSDSGKDLAVEIREFFIPDFSNWKDHDSFEIGFARLLKDLKAPESASPKPT